MKGSKTIPWQRIKGLFRPWRGGILCLCLGMAAQAALQVGLAALTRYVMDAALDRNGNFLHLAAALLAVTLLLVVLRSILSWTGSRLMDESTARLRYELLDAAERSSGERLRDYHSGALLNRGMEDIRTLCDGAINLFPTFLGNLIRMIAAFAVITLFSPPLAWVLVAVGAAVGLGVFCLRPILRKRQREVRQAEERSFSNLQENVQQLELLQAMGAEKESLRRYQTHLDRALSAKKQRRKLSVGGGTVLSLLAQLGTGCVLLWGIVSVSDGRLSFGELTALLRLLAMFRGPVVSLSGMWGRVAAVEVAGERLMELFEKPQAEEGGTDSQPKTVSAVVFEDVTFRYKPSEPPVLEHYSNRIHLSGWTCLSGISGRGKTTMLKLILGICQPQSGRVYLETDCGKVPCGPATRRLFAYVPQDVAFFSGSILENLLLVRPAATMEMCEGALELAQAYHFIQRLPMGLDTQVKEQRSGLSMGQLQRIAIARAVLMERPVFLLDECTSALDSNTERAVLQTLKALGRGAVVVTHRPEALDGVDDVRCVDMEECG